MELKDVVLCSAVRTPLGSFGGTLRNFKVYDLGTMVLRETIKRGNINPETVDEVIVSHCRQAGNGPNPARTAAVKAGIPIEVPAHTVNKACPSGLKAIVLASQALRLDDAEVIVVGGMESLSTIPYLLENCRWEGFRMGNRALVDGWGGAVDPLCKMGMGITAENLSVKYNISRREQDEWGMRSHQMAAKAWDNGWFDKEIMPVTIPATKKTPEIVFTKDETFRPNVNLEAMLKLPPAFKEGGTVTAGNSSSMSDGASAIIMTTRQRAKELGLRIMASMVSYSYVGVEPALMGEGPAIAIPKALKRADLTLNDMDLIEVNEAFAAQILANERVLKWDRNKVNIHGGAIALGHPTGLSGVRLMTTLLYAMHTHQKELAVVAICGGGGMGVAIVVKAE
jgi:acetyl-CoA C-acetyltransferase